MANGHDDYETPRTDPSPRPSLRDLAWPAATARLTLRPAELGDSAALWGYRKLPEVSRWLGWQPADREDWETGYRTRYLDLLVVEDEGRIIGDIMIHTVDGWAQREAEEDAAGSQAELGWTFHPDAGGRGYATEAVKAAMSLCFVALGLRRVHADAFEANEPSWRLMERVGMRREAHTVQASLHREFGWLNGVSYALLAAEWFSRTIRAESRDSGTLEPAAQAALAPRT